MYVMEDVTCRNRTNWCDLKLTLTAGEPLVHQGWGPTTLDVAPGPW
ncbi:hypothetical protein M2427_003829 [Bradyrhizobium sp. BR13661]|jgi:hypothetical protein|nr:hypothetical protein [Bradyrhizobium sp. BR13661]